jgi:hypothetical protein
MLSENEKRIKELCQELGQCLYEQSQMALLFLVGEIVSIIKSGK